MQFFSMPTFWLVAIIVFVIAEGATLGLTSIWFAVGSLFAMVAALLGANLVWQIALFAVGSGAMLLFIRPMLGKLKPNSVKTNADRIIGQKAVVTLEIDRDKSQGQVRVGGQIWTARSEATAVIAEGTEVEILSISGAHVNVKEIN